MGDFFAKKNKKKIVGSNLNKSSVTVKPEAKKTKAKDAEEDGWEEEQVVAATMKVEVAGQLTRDEEKKEQEDTAAPAWGKAKQVDSQKRMDLTDKKYPTLAKSVQSSSISIDDGSDPKVNIATSKNVFAALEKEEEDDEANTKRPKEIKPAMVQKKKGEREKAAIQREVEKYCGKKEQGKKDKKAEDDDDEEDDEADDDEPEEPKEEAKPKRKEEKKEEKKASSKAPEPEKEVEDDCKIVADLVAAKAKYQGRKKLPPKELSASELAEEKENQKPPPQKKKKWANFDEDYDDKARRLEEIAE